MATLKYLSQYFSTTLNVGGGIDDSQTTGIVLQSVSGVTITNPGQICITYSDPLDTSVAEWIDYTSINGSNELVGVTRGREGFSAKSHLQNATVAFVFSASHHNDVVDEILDIEDASTNSFGIYNSSLSRQAIINGNFDVWQRGTSVAWGNGVYTADRWLFVTGSGQTGTVTRQDGTGVPGSQYSMRVQRTAGQLASNNEIYYAMETADSIKFRGKKLTLSFWAIAGANFSPTSSLLPVAIVTGKGTDQKVASFTTTADAIAENKTLTTSWQKFTITTTAVIASDITQIGLRFSNYTTGTAGAADYFEITQVQLCAGDVALPFQPKSFNQELLDCMRYYEKSFDYATAPAQNTAADQAQEDVTPMTAWTYRVYYKVIKRIAGGVVIIYNPAAANANVRDLTTSTDIAPTLANKTQNGFLIYGTAAAADHRIAFNWTAESEL